MDADRSIGGEKEWCGSKEGRAEGGREDQAVGPDGSDEGEGGEMGNPVARGGTKIGQIDGM